MRILSWNVNGLRACAREAFPRLLRESAADVIGVQEVRALPAQLDAATRAPAGWHACFAPGGPGYSGVAIYSRAKPDEVLIGVGERRFDVEGRLIIARFGRMFVVNGYFPKGSGSKRDNSRVPYKLGFYEAAFATRSTAAPPRRGLRDRRLQHRARRDRSRAAEGEREVERLFARGARGFRALDRRGLGGHLPRTASRRSAAITRGGGSGAERASATSVGGSTTCSRRRAPRNG